MGQIGPKWDKSGTFSNQISVHFGAAVENGIFLGYQKYIEATRYTLATKFDHFSQHIREKTRFDSNNVLGMSARMVRGLKTPCIFCIGLSYLIFD